MTHAPGVDATLFPSGMRNLSDYVHARGHVKQFTTFFIFFFFLQLYGIFQSLTFNSIVNSGRGGAALRPVFGFAGRVC